ncbi:hypothetical protein O181_061045 [Austropuccinia psidii MF-1]|uniref:Uncharacterized protein n=1 Tax=Austropuccinia psidii MF-1 TaxID=1389203 RepID=A0A9Q3ELL2_9BASI|nr:hypothetical protein [Austropuccinia psidii MF-1]
MQMNQMTTNMSSRLNSLEKNIENIKKNDEKNKNGKKDKQIISNIPVTLPNQQNLINRLIAENEELKRCIQDLEKNKTQENNNMIMKEVRKTVNEQNMITCELHPLPEPPNNTINLFNRGNVLIRAKHEKGKPAKKIVQNK